MARIANIKGMILEEVVLALLNISGFRSIEAPPPGDSTLDGSISTGLKVLGRGGIHQIDAIADSMLSLPFSNTQRLLVEAKCYSGHPAGIEIVRNAIGVIKDVNEYWESRGGVPAKPRYHYLYALFSATGYTNDAEKYAYAHDIYLFPITQSLFIQPIIRKIQKITPGIFGKGAKATNVDINLPLTDLRKSIRMNMRDQSIRSLVGILNGYPDAVELIDSICTQCRRMGGALIATISNRIPIFLVPRPGLNIANMRDEYHVSIHWSENRQEKGWILHSDERELFSFDLPPVIFNYYTDQGFLSPMRALDLKQEIFSDMYAFINVNNRIKTVHFALQPGWIDIVRNRILSYK